MRSAAEFLLGGLVRCVCALTERSTKRMSNPNDPRCPDRCDCCPRASTDFLRVSYAPARERKIDLVLKGNEDSFAVRALHGIDSAVLNSIERLAQDAYALELSTKCHALRSLADQLDAEWANELRATAAACS